MYVYKKKCDEDYYLSIIQSTQQQYMFKNQQKPNNFKSQGYRPYNYACSDFFMNNNPYNNNYYNPYKTPESPNYTGLYNNYNNNNQCNIYPSPVINRNENNYGYHNNGNRRHIMEDQILYNKLNNINDINNNQSIDKIQKSIINEFENEKNNKYINNNFHNYNNKNQVNKKIFKLEDFLSGTKRNNLNDKFNRAANDGF